MNYVHAIILAIIEGLTEFLPISSTGHMVLASSFMNIAQDDFTKYFEVNIQFGAILSVLVLYFKKFVDVKNKAFYIKLLISIIPALMVGKLLDDFIDDKLGNPIFIAAVMIAGGFVLLFVDKLFNKSEIESIDEATNLNAFYIGLFQTLAIFFPGLSRSAASIIGGMQQKLSRSAAAEFSFFMAVPTLFAASAYKTLSYYKDFGMFSSEQIKILALGNVIAFIVAVLAIKFFIQFVKDRGFKIFGFYRIIVGTYILILLLMNK